MPNDTMHWSWRIEGWLMGNHPPATTAIIRHIRWAVGTWMLNRHYRMWDKMHGDMQYPRTAAVAKDHERLKDVWDGKR